MCERKVILCVGMCVLDIIHVCKTYPEEDTDKRCLQGHWQRGGNASNNCTVLRNLGAECEFLGVLSNSKAFQFLEEDCHQRGIMTENCPKTDKDPPFSSVILSQDSQSRTIIHSNMNFPILQYRDFKRINLAEYKWIHFEARNPEETSLMMETVIQFNNENKDQIVISLELEKLKEENLILAEKSNFIFLGKDLAMHLGWKDVKSACFGLRDKLENKKTVIFCTWGSVGSAVLDCNNYYHSLEAHLQSDVVDTLGAGDTFCAAVIYALVKGNSCKKAAEIGNKVAAYKLSSYGYDHIQHYKKVFFN